MSIRSILVIIITILVIVIIIVTVCHAAAVNACVAPLGVAFGVITTAQITPAPRISLRIIRRRGLPKLIQTLVRAHAAPKRPQWQRQLS